jgi:hypothetical protein
MSGVALVQFSTLELGKLLPLGRQAFGRNLAEAADNAGFDPPLHHMLCIASMKDASKRPSAKAVIPYLNLFHAGFIIAADERDFADILELTGMPTVLVDSNTRGIKVAFVAGSLSQWRDAVLRGCQKHVSREARDTFNKIFAEFKRVGLTDIFEARQVPSQDSTFFLEHHK